MPAYGSTSAEGISGPVQTDRAVSAPSLPDETADIPLKTDTQPETTVSKAKAKKKSPVKSPVLKFVDWASYSQLSLRWSRVKGADGYLVQRSAKADGKYKKLTVKKGEKRLHAYDLYK